MGRGGRPRQKVCKKGHDLSVNRMTSVGGGTYCGLCKKAYYARRSVEIVSRSRRFKLLNRGSSPEEYENMYRAQNGLCAICGKEDSTGYRLAMDHDHSTGAIRDLLCRRCNLTLGKIGDDMGLLMKMIAYLNKHQRLFKVCA